MRKTYILSIDKTSLEVREENEYPVGNGKVLLNICCPDMKFDPTNPDQVKAFEVLFFDFIFGIFISKKQEEI